MRKTVELRRVSSVLVFVDDWVAAAHWWARITGARAVNRVPAAASLSFAGVEMVFRPPDERNASGGSPVLYWQVEAFNATRSELRAWGCVELHYPLEIPGGHQITQFRDPFGTIFGIEGPVGETEPVWPEVHAELGRQ